MSSLVDSGEDDPPVSPRRNRFSLNLSRVHLRNIRPVSAWDCINCVVLNRKSAYLVNYLLY